MEVIIIKEEQRTARKAFHVFPWLLIDFDRKVSGYMAQRGSQWYNAIHLVWTHLLSVHSGFLTVFFPFWVFYAFPLPNGYMKKNNGKHSVWFVWLFVLNLWWTVGLPTDVFFPFIFLLHAFTTIWFLFQRMIPSQSDASFGSMVKNDSIAPHCDLPVTPLFISRTPALFLSAAIAFPKVKEHNLAR